MLLRLALIAAVIALAACGSSAASGGPAISCAPAGARTIARNGVASVYSSGKSVYGCSDQTHKRWKLGQSKTCLGAPLVQAVKLAGSLAAYGAKTCGVDTGTAAVVVRRLTDGKQLFTGRATTGFTGVESYQSVQSLVLKSDGAVAWIGTSRQIFSTRSAVEVHAVSHARQSLLDSGTAIAPGSLRLSGSKLSWKHGAAERTATLS